MRRAPRLLTLAILGVVVWVVPVSSGQGAVRLSSMVSPKLVGSWTRTVSAAEARHAAAPATLAGSVWTLEIEKDGTAATFDSKGAGSFEGTISAAGPSLVRLKLGTPPATYRWHIANQRLTFTKVADTVRDRIAVFVGTWKRK